MLFCKCRQLVIIGHEKSIKRAGIDAQAAKDAFAIVDLWHDGLLVLFPQLVNLDHAYSFCNTLTGDCAQLTACALVVEEDVSSFVTSNADTSLWVKLITVANELELLFWVAEGKALDNEVL